MPDDLHELSALYALDALAGEDRDRFERHLEGCEECRKELDALRGAGASLAFAVDGPAPPVELRARVLAAARAEPQNVVPLRRRRFGARAVGALAAAAAVVAVVAGVLSTRDGSGSTRAILNDPGARHIAVDGRGQLVVASSGDAVLDVSLPALPAGKTYEAWVSLPKVQSAGEFSGHTFKLRARVHRDAQVMVTVEREGGVDAPTSKPIIVVQT
jgi:anti-sigma factor RsiW